MMQLLEAVLMLNLDVPGLRLTHYVTLQESSPLRVSVISTARTKHPT